jgi:cellobiose phosphorylase
VDVTLEPGACKELIFNLGVCSGDKSVVGKYRSVEEVDAGLERVRARWNGYFDTVKVTTPESGIDTFLNYWLPYQARVAFDVGRVASYYYWGISRGFGFRDTAQDTLAITASDPDLAHRRIRLLARQMFSTGKVYHHFTADGQGETTGHCDDPFWFILAVTDYIKETGDTAILEVEEPFLDGKTGTVLDHLLSVTQLAKDDLGEHGLPIFGRGDWNDTLDYIGGDEGGESAWGAMFYVAMLNELIELLDFVGSDVDLRPLRDRMASAVEEHGWDGEWFIRAFGGRGRKIGSRECEAGKIYLNAQSWAVIAGIADREKRIQCMDSVKFHLDTGIGPKICAPAYREIDPSIGLVTRCVAGKKENGAVFCHPVTWCIMAECLLGRGSAAFDYFKKTLPGAVDQEVFCAEPYVYSQYITSDEHGDPGRASHSWQTGTAAWMKRVIIDYMLGVRAGYQGLVIDPVIPAHWKRFKVDRRFRGVLYRIEIENPEGLERGVKTLTVDGEVIEGTVVPMPKTGECRVRLILG